MVSHSRSRKTSLIMPPWVAGHLFVKRFSFPNSSVCRRCWYSTEFVYEDVFMKFLGHRQSARASTHSGAQNAPNYQTTKMAEFARCMREPIQPINVLGVVFRPRSAARLYVQQPIWEQRAVVASTNQKRPRDGHVTFFERCSQWAWRIAGRHVGTHCCRLVRLGRNVM